MCGIAGIFGTGNIALEEGQISRMMSAIAHRGPDGTGKLLFSRAALGHVRLAIIDIEGGAQPMSTADGRYHIIYNGELYNFRELREDLQRDGVQFVSQSDTEVILRAIKHHGTSILPDFRGMFAFAIWDEIAGEGYLIRDRFGIKPLFYMQVGAQLFFGSEIKAILPHAPNGVAINMRALHLLMNFRYIPGDDTLFSGIRHVPPGSVLYWQKGRVSVQPWHSFKSHGGEVSHDSMRDLITQAVRRQLVSDVGLGAYLSGGLDSATIVNRAIKFQDRKTLPTFTIRTGDDPFEAVNATRTAQLFGVINHQGDVDEDFSAILQQLIYHLEVPKVNAWQSSLVARLAAKKVKVVLSGLGGDEIFLGYNMHSLLTRFAKLHKSTGGMVRYLGRGAAKMCSYGGLGLEEFARGGKVLGSFPDIAAAYGIIRNVWDTPEERKRIYGPRMLECDLPDCFEWLRENWPENSDPVAAAADFELSNKMVNDLLLQEDRLSMAYGLEVRVPFLDEDLVETMMLLSSTARMPGARKKGLMKQLVSPWLSDEILKRPKSGFQLPIHEVFDRQLRPLCEEYLNRSKVEEAGLFNPVFIETILSVRPQQSLRWHYFLLYLMVGTAIWMEVFIDGKVACDGF